MDQNEAADQASSVGRALMTDNDRSDAECFQDAGNNVEIRLQPQDASLSKELALAREHNAALPIHALPAEVFFQVIHLHMLYVLDLESDGADYYVHLFRLSGVCLHWYHVIRDSPPLWTRLNLSKPLQVVEIALQRSSSHPLDITLRVQTLLDHNLQSIADSMDSHTGRDRRRSMGVIDSHRDRWRSMVISVPDWGIEDVFKALREPVPNLEKLSFIDQNTIACTRELDLFGGNAPRLKHLTLNGVSIRWDSEVLHDLIFLSLSWIRFPSTDAILHALSHSPKLQKLRIINCSTESMATPSSPSVQLSQLLSLCAYLGGRAATKDFLDHIISDVKNYLSVPSSDGSEVGELLETNTETVEEGSTHLSVSDE